MQVRIPKLQSLVRLRPNAHAQTQYFILGITIPGMLLWVAHWMVFSLSVPLKFLEDNKASIEEVFPEFTFSDFFNNVLFRLNDNGSILLIVIGVLLAAFALALGLWMVRRYEVDSWELGKIRFQSVLMAVVISLVLVGAMAALLNQAFVYYFPQQVAQLTWV